MKPLFKCEIYYFPSLHLSQIYDGFEKLRKIGIVDIVIKPISGEGLKPLLKVKINNKYNVIYDTLDGMNWINGSIEENLIHFKNNTHADFYFKRSYNKQVLENAPLNCKVFPLGLNIPFKPEGKFPQKLNEKIKDFLKDYSFISKYFEKTSFFSKDFEFFPIPSKENKVLFIAGLWNPDDVTSEHLKIEREVMNKNRINCIKACQREFGDRFIGGVQKGDFSTNHSKDMIMPLSFTKRETFLKTIKEHNICIATSGLHNSIGWKFGEYVAASRAIITESLIYELPGDFSNNKNFLVFNNEGELLNNIYFLLNDKDALFNMMMNNFHYYNNYLRPDKLVLNTLLRIYQDI